MMHILRTHARKLLATVTLLLIAGAMIGKISPIFVKLCIAGPVFIIFIIGMARTLRFAIRHRHRLAECAYPITDLGEHSDIEQLLSQHSGPVQSVFDLEKRDYTEHGFRWDSTWDRYDIARFYRHQWPLWLAVISLIAAFVPTMAVAVHVKGEFLWRFVASMGTMLLSWPAIYSALAMLITKGKYWRGKAVLEERREQTFHLFKAHVRRAIFETPSLWGGSIYLQGLSPKDRDEMQELIFPTIRE